MSSGLRDGPPSTPKHGEPNVAVSILMKSMQPPECILAGTTAVAATVLSQISSLRPVTGAGRNARLSLRLRRPGEEEGELMGQTLSTTGTGLSEPGQDQQ